MSNSLHLSIILMYISLLSEVGHLIFKGHLYLFFGGPIIGDAYFFIFINTFIFPIILIFSSKIFKAFYNIGDNKTL